MVSKATAYPPFTGTLTDVFSDLGLVDLLTHETGKEPRIFVFGGVKTCSHLGLPKYPKRGSSAPRAPASKLKTEQLISYGHHHATLCVPGPRVSREKAAANRESLAKAMYGFISEALEMSELVPLPCSSIAELTNFMLAEINQIL